MGNLIFDGKGIIGHDLIVKMKRSIEMLLQGFPPITVNGTAKEPITALTVYGHSKQDGTPSPENPVPIVSAGSVMTTGKNVLPPEFSAEVHMNIPAGTKCFLVTDGTPSNGGNILLYDAEGNVHYLAIDAGDTESTNPYGSTYNADIVRFVNRLVPGVNTAMYIEEKLPYEPYTGGVPGVNPYEGDINVSVSDGGTQSQTLILSTPGGLPGIPVTSGGNYTDENGQKWICNEVDFKREVYVQRIIRYTGPFYKMYWAKTDSWFVIASSLANIPKPSYRGFCNISDYYMDSWDNLGHSHWFLQTGGQQIVIHLGDTYNTEEAVEQFIEKNEIVVYYAAETPIETDLPAEEIAAYKDLHTYSPTTTVGNDAEAWMKVGVIME